MNSDTSLLSVADRQEIPPAPPSAKGGDAVDQSVDQSVDLPAASPEADLLPERSRQIALARADLLRLYRQAASLAGPKKATAAKGEFVASYNLGAYPQLYAVVGEASRQSLERWDRTLRASGDPWDLAPKYGQHRRGQGFGGEFFQALEKEGVENLFKCIEGFPEVKYLLAQALHYHHPPIAEAVRLAKEKMTAHNLPVRSERTYTRFLEAFRGRYYGLWLGCRRGEKAVNDQVCPYLVRDYDQLEVGDVLVADGHKFNFEILNPWTGRPQRMTLLLFYDMKSNFPAGWEIMPTENTHAIAVAMRRAILLLGKVPRCAYLDNGKAFRARYFRGTEDLRQAGVTGLFARLGIEVVSAWPYHGQSKTVEPFFGKVGEFERQMPTYMGRNIEDKPAYLHMGEKWHRRLHQKITGDFVPSIEQVHRALARWFEKYGLREQKNGHLKGLKPLEVFEAGRGPGVNHEDLRELMMKEVIKRPGQNGFRLPDLGEDHYYHPKLAGRRHEVLVRYDLWEPDFILVYETTGKFICRAEPWGKVHPIARITGTDADVAEVSRKIEIKRGVTKEAMSGVRTLCEAIVVPETRARLEDQGLAGEGGNGKKKAKVITITAGAVTKIRQDFEAAAAQGDTVLEALPAPAPEEEAPVLISATANEAAKINPEASEGEHYEHLMKLEVQGVALSRHQAVTMRMFEMGAHYGANRDYYEALRARLVGEGSQLTNSGEAHG